MESESSETKTFKEFCQAWQADDLEIIPDDYEDTDPRFFIKFKVEFKYPPALPLFDEIDNLSLVQLDLDSIISYYHFWEKCRNKGSGDQLSQEILPWCELSKILTKIRIPLHKQPFMLHTISKCAEEIASLSGNLGLKVLPMMVNIGISADYLCFNLQESSYLATRESPNFARLSEEARAANELEIEALEKKIVQHGDQKGMICMICREEAEIGCEMVAMGITRPCSHFYHGDCLLRWLKIANFCPLCSLN